MEYSVPSKDRMARGRRPCGILSCPNFYANFAIFAAACKPGHILVHDIKI